MNRRVFSVISLLLKDQGQLYYHYVSKLEVMNYLIDLNQFLSQQLEKDEVCHIVHQLKMRILILQCGQIDIQPFLKGKGLLYSSEAIIPPKMPIYLKLSIAQRTVMVNLLRFLLSLLLDEKVSILLMSDLFI